MLHVLLMWLYGYENKVFKKFQVISCVPIFCAILEFRERRSADQNTSRQPPKHDDSRNRIGKAM